MKKIILLLSLTLITLSCQDQTKNENPIAKFQQNLVDQGITGSNVTQVYKDGNVIYSNITNSGAFGDKDINDNTIFPIWSMSKTVTTVAMMILLDDEMYDLNDNVEDYFVS